MRMSKFGHSCSLSMMPLAERLQIASAQLKPVMSRGLLRLRPALPSHDPVLLCGYSSSEQAPDQNCIGVVTRL